MSNIFETKDLIKYPFIREAREYVRSKGLNIEDVFSVPEFKPIVERAYERIISAIDKGTIPYRIDASMDEEILSFPTAILMISIVGNDSLAYKYAVAESKRAEKLFKKETPEKLIHIGKSLEWNTDIEEINGIKYLLVHVVTYVSLASSLSGENWLLSLQRLSRGYVKLSSLDEYARLLSEGVKQHILRLFNPVVNINYSEASEYVEKLIKISEEKFKPTYSIIYEAKSITETFYPPCIRVMLGELKAGKNPPHLARFSIVTFLRSVGWNSEDVVKLFVSAADFNERITRYQVEHIYGLRGSKTVYNMPSCNTLKAANLCYAADNPICAKIKHPLQYVRISYRRGRKENETKNVE